MMATPAATAYMTLVPGDSCAIRLLSSSSSPSLRKESLWDVLHGEFQKRGKDTYPTPLSSCSNLVLASLYAATRISSSPRGSS